ncbi:MAG: CHAD domain-containing protein [Nocardioides sp.]|nr:CHAD domain-containing protein [Nocardioides sp.]
MIPEQTGSAFLDYVGQHHARLLEQDALVRSGEGDGVHQMRVAARRMRSALATYRPVLAGEAPAALADELRWIGGVLSPARDAEVLQQRLDAILETQPTALVVGRVAQRLDDELGEWSRAARVAAETELDGEHYRRLLEDLERFVSEPPFDESASRSARKRLPKLLHADLARVLKRHGVWERTDDPAQKEHQLHQVRKAAKRLRYAAESALPVFGERAALLAGRAEALQELLGEHQDTVVARRVLLKVGRHAHDAGEDAFTFGRLHALEEARAGAIVTAYPSVLAKLPDTDLRDWLRH